MSASAASALRCCCHVSGCSSRQATQIFRSVAGQRHLPPHTSGAASLQRLSQRSSQAAVAWLRSASGTTHCKPTLLENTSQPDAAVRIQIILVYILFGKHRTVWEGADRGFASARAFCTSSVPICPERIIAHSSIQSSTHCLPARSSTLDRMRAILMRRPRASGRHQRAHPPINRCDASLQSATFGTLTSSAAQHSQQSIPPSDHRICLRITPSGGYSQGTSAVHST